MAFGFMRKGSRRRVTRGSGELYVDLARCPQNHLCPSVPICPTNALSQHGFAAPDIDHDACVSCGRCVSYCPKNALLFKEAALS